VEEHLKIEADMEKWREFFPQRKYFDTYGLQNA